MTFFQTLLLVQDLETVKIGYHSQEIVQMFKSDHTTISLPFPPSFLA